MHDNGRLSPYHDRMTQLAEPVWRSTRRARGAGAGTAITDHAVREGHTLCGIATAGQEWSEPIGRRCTECATVPEGYAVYQDIVSEKLSYRQLDYWTRIGLLRCVSEGSGSGHRRYWPAEDAQVAILMGRYVAAGLPPKTAHRAARNDGWLAPGVRVVLSSDHEESLGDGSPDVVPH